MSDQEKQLVLSRAHEHNSMWQAAAREQAKAQYRRWQEWEDEAILDPYAEPDHLLALELNRTLMAVRGRRRDLKRKQQSSQ
jgi:hypothetical protein